jgi:hypothetical protein
MNPQSTRAGCHAGDFISEDAVRGALGGRRRTPQATPVDADAGVTAAAVTAADGASAAVRQTAPLRRWSVAELIARAVARPADGLSR